MKTKFILHGGYTREQNELNEGFFKEIAQSVPDKGTVLLVYFASDDGADQRYEEDKIRISNFTESKEVTFVRATENDFINQVKNSDVVYLRGGDTQKLKDQLSVYPELHESILGKTVAATVFPKIDSCNSG